MSKKAKLDLLVRVRYLNPLPPPPFPPKLVNIPTNVSRLGDPSYLNDYVATAPLPMLVDAEMGMPLDLNQYDGVWEGNDASLNPALDPARVLDPEDAELMLPLAKTLTVDGVEKGPSASEVSWIRNSNLFTRKMNTKRKAAVDTVQGDDQYVDASEAAQLMAIDKTFSEIRDVADNQLRHPDPKKKHLRVVESYDFLPNEETWATPSQYSIARFPERPSAATATNPSAHASSSRLDRAVIRPIQVADDLTVMDYYLPSTADVERSEELFSRPLDAAQVQAFYDGSEEDPSAPPPEAMPYEHIRVYETVSLIPYPEKEVVLTFNDDLSSGAAGQDGEQNIFGDDQDVQPNKRKKGVYYNTLMNRVLLRKTRRDLLDGEDGRPDQWDRIRLAYREVDAGAVEARRGAAAQVTEPAWTGGQIRQLQSESAMVGQGEAIDDEEPLRDEVAERIQREVDAEDDEDD